MYFQAQNILISYLVLTTTKSVFLVGVVNALNFSSYLFSIYSGVAADRYSKKHIIMYTNASQVLLSAAFGLLALEHVTKFSIIASLILVSGIMRAFVQPTRLAFVTEVVDSKEIASALSLSSTSQYVGGILGPALVGALTDITGIGTIFFINAFLIGMGVVFLTQIRVPDRERMPNGQQRPGVASELRTGFSASWSNKAILGGQLTYFVTNLFMFPCYWTLIPIFAVNVLHLTASGLGWLVTANGVGGILSTMTIATRNPRRRGLIMSITATAWGVMYLIMANVAHVGVAEVVVFSIGMLGSFTQVLASIIIQTSATKEIRGRAAGLQTLAISSQGPGSLVAGEFAQVAGPAGAFDIEALLFIVGFGILVAALPSFRKT